MAQKELVNSVIKAVEIIRLVGRNDKGMRLIDISRELDMPSPTAYNLVRTLIHCDFLENIDSRVNIGKGLLELAGRGHNVTVLEKGERLISALAEVIPDAVLVFGLAGKNGIEQRFRVSPDRPGILQRKSGEIMQPHHSASGLLGLAYGDEDTKFLLEEQFPFSEFGIKVWENRASLDSFLEEVRKRELALSPFDTDQLFRAAVPIFDRKKQLIATIGFSLPARKYTEASARNKVLKTIIRLTKEYCQ